MDNAWYQFSETQNTCGVAVYPVFQCTPVSPMYIFLILQLD